MKKLLLELELATKVERIERGIVAALAVQVWGHNFRAARFQVSSILREIGVYESHYLQEEA